MSFLREPFFYVCVFAVVLFGFLFVEISRAQDAKMARNDAVMGRPFVLNGETYTAISPQNFGQFAECVNKSGGENAHLHWRN